MSKILFLLFFTLLCMNAICQPYSPSWVTSSGGTGDDRIWKIIVDSEGNTFSIGWFQSTVTFGTTTLTAIGDFDVFISKSDSDGNWVWAKQCGGSGTDYGHGIALDNQNNLYITGTFSQNAIFGTTTLISSGSDDVFVCKLDSNGNWLWVKQCGGNSQDVGYGIATGINCIYITGYFFGTATFGINSLNSSGLTDIYVAKLDLLGNWIWARKAGGDDYDYGGSSITVDNLNNAYLTGHYFSNPANFGVLSIANFGNADMFVSKIDSDGNWDWANHYGGAGWEDGYSVLWKNDYLYLTGGYNSQNASFGTNVLSNAGNLDMFVGKMDNNGNWVWVNNCGGTGEDYSYGIALDVFNNVLISGVFHNTINVNGTDITSSGDSDILISQLDNNGNWVYSFKSGGTGFDWCYYGIAADTFGNVFYAGDISNTASVISHNVTSIGFTDVFIAKYLSVTSITPGTPTHVVPPPNVLIASVTFETPGSTSFDINYSVLNINALTHVPPNHGLNNNNSYAVILNAATGTVDLTVTVPAGTWWISGYWSGSWHHAVAYPYSGVVSGTVTLYGIPFDTKGDIPLVISEGEGMDPTLPVTLSSFSAIVTSNCFVNLTWVTQSETEALGYIIHRSNDSYFSNANRLNSVIIPATNTSQQQTYSLTDTEELTINHTYCYWLEYIDMEGNNNLHGPISATIIGENVSELPTLTSICNAYPNPIRVGASINMDVNIKTGETGIVSIYNIRGQNVKTFIVKQGENNLIWQAKDCGSGIYFYNLSTPSFNSTKKLVILN